MTCNLHWVTTLSDVIPIMTLSDSTQGLQTVMDSISDASARLGLMISRKKTKIMLSGDHQTTPDILVGQDKVDVVDDFTYLGSSINSQGSMDHEISCRIEKKLDAFDSRCLRKILGIKWDAFVRNEVRDRSQQTPVSNTICGRRMNWLGHVSRLPPSRLANQVLWWNPPGRRRRGRPKMNWHQTIQRDLHRVNRGWSDVRSLTADRSAWRALAASCVGRRRSPQV
ncbi:uncharacterized protein [Asterias amurensis]|uniref:uncharacterized protein n=1 Tax=Asterias amurensis TaxID=7602 RepID=UPI003AB4667D